MKWMIFLLICIFSSTLLWPDSNTSVVENNVTASMQKSETEVLKEKIRALEEALAHCQQVKPLTGNSLLNVTKTHVSKNHDHEKFTFSNTEPVALSTYFTANAMPLDVLRNKLKENGFDVLSEDEILDNKIVISISNEALKKSNSFLAVLHLLVSDENEIHIQNPSYFAAAYLQDKYTYGDFNTTVKALENVFGTLYKSDEQVKFSDLEDYNFMIGMPNVNDTITVANGENIFENISEEDAEKFIAYRLFLPNGNMLVGQKLNKKIYEYLLKIDAVSHALVFPYPVIVEKNSAYTLAPKYYLALSMPLMRMTDFMKIASAPNAIIEAIKEAYMVKKEMESEE